jgi:crotonobetainyl-CoA:carnitine CoA-transferase CaiB-like acyl-CoA transferase
MPELPLQNLRVLDLTQWYAGPFAAMILADMGAEVIKIESIQRLDGWRGGAVRWLGEIDKFWEHSPLFNSIQRNKYGLTLNLTSSQGADLFKRLAQKSDVVMENFSPRVMPQFGLDYPVLKELNPRLIMTSQAGFGLESPWRDYVSWGPTAEGISGISHVVGYPGEPPMILNFYPADTLSALFTVLAILFALKQREKTGKGQHIDLAQSETAMATTGELFMDYVMNRRTARPDGNRHANMAPHGCYRARGKDEWVAIAVGADREWEAMCKAMGTPPWSKDDRFSSQLSRWRHQEELDRLVSTWTVRQDKWEITRLLQEAGVAAGPVMGPVDFLADPHLKERGFFEVVDRSLVGPKTYPNTPIRFSKTPSHIRLPAPTVGEHNEHILGSVLGLSQKEIESLVEEKVIGNEPLEAVPTIK